MSKYSFKTVGVHDFVSSQIDFIQYTDESKLNELLWRIQDGIIVNHMYEYNKNNYNYDISNITITSELHKNKDNDINGYIRYYNIPYKTYKQINKQNLRKYEYAHTTFHFSGLCIDKKLSGILHTKNTIKECYIRILVGNEPIMNISGSIINNTLKFHYNNNTYNILQHNPYYTLIIDVLNEYFNDKSAIYLREDISGKRILEHPLIKFILQKRLQSKVQYKRSITFRQRRKNQYKQHTLKKKKNV